MVSLEHASFLLKIASFLNKALSFQPTLVSQYWILEQQATEPEFNNTLFLPKLLFSPSSESPHCQVHWSFLSSHPLIHDSTGTASISLLHTNCGSLCLASRTRFSWFSSFFLGCCFAGEHCRHMLTLKPLHLLFCSSAGSPVSPSPSAT